MMTAPLLVSEIPARVRFTYEMVKKLNTAGIDFGAPFELLDGDIVYKMPKNYPHIVTTNKTLRWIYSAFGIDHVLSQDNILLASTNAPEPDITVLRQAIEEYNGIPTGDDVQMVIEVSDTTLNFDRQMKAGWYAVAGIPEYWIMDVSNRQVYVHRDPLNGIYTSIMVHSATDTIAPLAAPQSTVIISSLLPELT